MPISFDNIISILRTNLTPQEVSQSIAYIAETPVAEGTRLEFPHISIEIPWSAFIAFVDRDPMANWSHSCRYIIINRESGDIRSFEAQFPPFTSKRQMHWRLVYKAPSVPTVEHLDE